MFSLFFRPVKAGQMTALPNFEQGSEDEAVSRAIRLSHTCFEVIVNNPDGKCFLRIINKEVVYPEKENLVSYMYQVLVGLEIV